MVILLTLILVGVAMWGQYWYDRAHRLMDAMEYMIEEEVDNEAHPEQPEE